MHIALTIIGKVIASFPARARVVHIEIICKWKKNSHVTTIRIYYFVAVFYVRCCNYTLLLLKYWFEADAAEVDADLLRHEYLSLLWLAPGWCYSKGRVCNIIVNTRFFILKACVEVKLLLCIIRWFNYLQFIAYWEHRTLEWISSLLLWSLGLILWIGLLSRIPTSMHMHEWIQPYLPSFVDLYVCLDDVCTQTCNGCMNLTFLWGTTKQ